MQRQLLNEQLRHLQQYQFFMLARIYFIIQCMHHQRLLNLQLLPMRFKEMIQCKDPYSTFNSSAVSCGQTCAILNFDKCKAGSIFRCHNSLFPHRALMRVIHSKNISFFLNNHNDNAIDDHIINPLPISDESCALRYLFAIICMIDYSYLTPPSKATRIKLPPSYIYESVNGRHIRRIFTRSLYEPFEREAIDKLKQYLKKKAPNIYYPDELLLRFNYAGNFHFSDVTERVKLYDEWHQNEVISNLNKSSREILEYGHVYSYGRDYDYSPIIIVRPNKFDLKKYDETNYLNAVANLLAPLEKYMLVGGVIEKWNVLIDFQSKKLTASTQQLLKNLTKILHAYPYRLKRVLFVNANNSPLLPQLSDLIKKFDLDVHVQNINSLEDLTRAISTDEREKKYGGTLQNVCEYWPIHTTNKYEETESNFERTEYESAINDPVFFEDPKPPLCDFTNSKCIIY